MLSPLRIYSRHTRGGPLSLVTYKTNKSEDQKMARLELTLISTSSTFLFYCLVPIKARD